MPDSLRVRLDEDQLDELATRIAARLTQTAASPFVNVAEAAALLCCSEHRIRDLLSARRLTTLKEGRRTLLDRDEVIAHVRRRGE